MWLCLIQNSEIIINNIRLDWHCDLIIQYAYNILHYKKDFPKNMYINYDVKILKFKGQKLFNSFKTKLKNYYICIITKCNKEMYSLVILISKILDAEV